MLDVIFSPQITPGSSDPPTPASDVGDYFPSISDSGGEDSADHQLAELDLSGIDSLKSLDTVDPADQTLEQLVKADSAELVKPTTMTTPNSPEPSSDLVEFDSDELEVAPSDSPPPSPTPSGTSNNPIPADIRRQLTCLACGIE